MNNLSNSEKEFVVTVISVMYQSHMKNYVKPFNI